MALIYPQMATAADYFPADAVVVLSESPRVAERGKNYLWQLTEDATVVVGRLLFARAHIAWFELHTVCVKAFGASHHHALVAAWRAALGAVGACGPVLRLFACHLLS